MWIFARSAFILSAKGDLFTSYCFGATSLNGAINDRKPLRGSYFVHYNIRRSQAKSSGIFYIMFIEKNLYSEIYKTLVQLNIQNVRFPA